MSSNATVALLERLRRRSVRVDLRGERLHVSAPPGAVTTSDRDELRNLKAELLQRLRLEAQVVDLSLDDFARQDHSLELAVPWLAETIWWVPRAEHIGGLVRDGVHRGRIWTAQELTDLTRLNDHAESRADIERITKLKLAFDATILSVDEDSPPSREQQRPVGGTCIACRGSRFWVSTYGVRICAHCHPPARADLVARWIGDRDHEAEATR